MYKRQHSGILILMNTGGTESAFAANSIGEFVRLDVYKRQGLFIAALNEVVIASLRLDDMEIVFAPACVCLLYTSREYGASQRPHSFCYRNACYNGSTTAHNYPRPLTLSGTCRI